MVARTAIARPTAKSIASYVRKNAGAVKRAQAVHHMAQQTIREADYEGHHIVIRTTYEIEVDGKHISGHMAVTNDGRVHYHPVPNVSFASAVDLVKQLIDIFPDDFVAGPHSGNHKHRAERPRKSAVQRRRRSNTQSRRK